MSVGVCRVQGAWLVAVDVEAGCRPPAASSRACRGSRQDSVTGSRFIDSVYWGYTKLGSEQNRIWSLPLAWRLVRGADGRHRMCQGWVTANREECLEAGVFPERG